MTSEKELEKKTSNASRVSRYSAFKGLTFETECGENDWQFILEGSYLETTLAFCNHEFIEKTVLINNVNNLDRVLLAAQKLVDRGVLDNYYVVDEFAEKVLDFFKLKSDNLHGEYYNSIAELTGVYLCRTKYLLHFSSQSFLEQDAGEWINKSINLLNDNEDIMACSPARNDNFKPVKDGAIRETVDFYLGFGFSDQCYMVRSSDLKKPIYLKSGPQNPGSISNRKGQFFEKSIVSYMRNKKLLRATSKTLSYQHNPFPKDKLNRLIRKIKIRARSQKVLNRT